MALRDVGQVSIGTVESDFNLRGAKGDVHVKSVGGDASLRDVEGKVTLNSVSDDLALRGVSGDLKVDVNDDVVVHLDRLVDGGRKAIQITEVQGMEGDTIVMQDIFRFVQTGVREGRVEGQFTATGVRPKFMEQIESAGISLPPEMFVPANQAKSQKRRW